MHSDVIILLVKLQVSICVSATKTSLTSQDIIELSIVLLLKVVPPGSVQHQQSLQGHNVICGNKQISRHVVVQLLQGLIVQSDYCPNPIT